MGKEFLSPAQSFLEPGAVLDTEIVLCAIPVILFASSLCCIGEGHVVKPFVRVSYQPSSRLIACHDVVQNQAQCTDERDGGCFCARSTSKQGPINGLCAAGANGTTAAVFNSPGTIYMPLLQNATSNNGYTHSIHDTLSFPGLTWPPELLYASGTYDISQERKGSRVAVNHGQGGIAISGYYVGPIKFERPGPIANDPLNRAVQLQPEAKCRIDTKNTGQLLAPMQSHLSFSIEGWAKCKGGLDTTRYVLMTGRSVFQ